LKYIQLVEKARHGDKQCLERLAEEARGRLGVYVYRLTLAEDLTDEIVQESMLEMCKILGKLKRPDRFWPWLYGIATNKFHRHQRTERTQARAAKSAANRGSGSRQEGLENLVSQELKQIVSTAMRKLRTRHRAVLIMRCFDEMSYADIAESMGCSEFSTRMLFLRAKRSLQKELSRNGFGRGSLLTALILFGRMTAPSEAAAAGVSVTAATTKVGLAATLVGTAISKTALVSLTTAGVLAVGTIVVTSEPEKNIIGQQPGGNPHIFSTSGQANNSAEEYWYFFPEGANNPMMMRCKSNANGKESYSQLLQNDQANYYYRKNTIYINNYRTWADDLSVARLPTDNPQLSKFLSQVEGNGEQMEYVPGSQRGLLVIATVDRNQNGNRFWAIRHDNVLDEDYFQSDWPIGAGTIDNRDEMHKRGWTYFRIMGQVNGEKVSGAGRLPFVYATSRRYSAWLKLQVAGGLKITDSDEGARVYGAGGAMEATYKAGSFFKGLARPWMGLHSIDMVRRDAAEQRLWFATKRVSGNGKARVEVDHGQVKLIYTIDLETDVIDRITLSGANGIEGELRFSYLQNIDEVDPGNEFAKPRRRSYQKPQQYEEGLLWLVQLAEGVLGK